MSSRRNFDLTLIPFLLLLSHSGERIDQGLHRPDVFPKKRPNDTVWDLLFGDPETHVQGTKKLVKSKDQNRELSTYATDTYTQR